MKKLIGFVLLVASFAANAADYYVDTTITDTNVGSATPDCTTYNLTTNTCVGGSSDVFATNADVNTLTLAGGDTIYFRCGQTWREVLNITDSGDAVNGDITITSFGDCTETTKPRITPATLVTETWSDQTGNIWRADISSVTRLVVFNDEIAPKPETGATAPDRDYEWYYDGSQYLYVYAPSGGSGPASYYTSIERAAAGTEAYAIDLNTQSYITIDGIFAGKQNVAIFSGAAAKSNITVKNSILAFNVSRGVYVAGGVNSADYADYITIDNNIFNQIGFYGDSGASDIGLNQHLRRATVSNNTFIANGDYKVGVDGPTFNDVYGSGHVVENNECYGNHQENCIDLKHVQESVEGEGRTIVRGNYVHNENGTLGAFNFHFGTNGVDVYNNICTNVYKCFALINHTDPLDAEVGDINFYNNLIYNVTNVALASSNALAGGNSFNNNVVYDVGVDETSSYSLTFASPDWEIKNNLIKDVSRGKSTNYLLYITNVTNADVDNNIFAPDTAERNQRIYWGGANVSLTTLQGATYEQCNTCTDNVEPGWTDKDNGNFSLTWDAAAIGYGTDITGRTSDADGNPLYGEPDSGPFEYQPPYTAWENGINVNGDVRIYGDGKFRNTAAAGTVYIPLTIDPTSDDTSEYLDVTIAAWAGDSMQWNESSTTITGDVNHEIAGLAPGRDYNVLVDDVLGTDITGASCTSGVCTASASGVIAFTYGGTYSDHDFEVVPTDPIAGLVDTADGTGINADARYLQSPPINDACYMMRNGAWIEATCP